MPTGFLSDAERERLDRLPSQVLPGNIEIHFTLSRADRMQVPTTTSPANRLGFALAAPGVGEGAGGDRRGTGRAGDGENERSRTDMG